MLGVFRTNVVEQVHNPEKKSGLEYDLLEKYFTSSFDHYGIVNFGINGFMTYTQDQIYPELSKEFLSFPLCTVPSPEMYVNGNYCITRSGHNARVGPDIFTADYDHAKVRSDGTTFQFAQLSERNYNCILFDYDRSLHPENNCTHAFVVNCFKDVPLYWGIDSEGSCVVTDVVEFVNEVCGKSYSDIPSGTGMLIRVPVSAAPASSSSGDSG